MVLRCRYAREYGQLATARKGELGLLLRHTWLFRARAASGQTARTGPHLHRLRHVTADSAPRDTGNPPRSWGAAASGSVVSGGRWPAIRTA